MHCAQAMRRKNAGHTLNQAGKYYQLTAERWCYLEEVAETGYWILTSIKLLLRLVSTHRTVDNEQHDFVIITVVVIYYVHRKHIKICKLQHKLWPTTANYVVVNF